MARDLHDDLGTALTGVALELDVATRDLASPKAVTKDRIADTSQRVRALAQRMREVVWAVNPNCDNIPSLAHFLEEQAAPLLEAAGIACRLDFPEELPRIAIHAEVRHQIVLGVREALNNVIRHSGGTEVGLKLVLNLHELIISVSDNGKGFKPEVDRLNVQLGGHGLVNLRFRMAQLGGALVCHSTPGSGTTITFKVPLK